MKLKTVSNIETMLKTRRMALQKLVQRATETMTQMWIDDCMVSFGWDREFTEEIVKELRQSAKLELQENG